MPDGAIYAPLQKNIYAQSVDIFFVKSGGERGVRRHAFFIEQTTCVSYIFNASSEIKTFL
jgi:hypothetical protein